MSRRCRAAASFAPRQLECCRGITILELAMAMLVVAVLLGLSLPLASALAGRFKVGSARDAFVNTYARARAVAVQYGREARLHIAIDRGEFWVEGARTVDLNLRDIIGELRKPLIAAAGMYAVVMATKSVLYGSPGSIAFLLQVIVVGGIAYSGILLAIHREGIAEALNLLRGSQGGEGAI